MQPDRPDIVLKYAAAQTTLAVPADLFVNNDKHAYFWFLTTASKIHNSSIFEPGRSRDHLTLGAKVSALAKQAEAIGGEGIFMLDRDLDIIETLSIDGFVKQGWQRMEMPYRFMRDRGPTITCRVDEESRLCSRGGPVDDLIEFLRGKILKVGETSWLPADDSLLSQIFHGLALGMVEEKAAQTTMEHLAPLVVHIAENASTLSLDGVIDYLLAYALIRNDFEGLPAEPLALSLHLLGMRNEHRQAITLTEGTRSYWVKTTHPPLWQRAKDIPADYMDRYREIASTLLPGDPAFLDRACYVGVEVREPGASEVRQEVLAWLRSTHDLVGMLNDDEGGSQVTIWETDRYYILANDVFDNLLGLLTWDKPLQ